MDYTREDHEKMIREMEIKEMEEYNEIYQNKDKTHRFMFIELYVIDGEREYFCPVLTYTTSDKLNSVAERIAEDFWGEGESVKTDNSFQFSSFSGEVFTSVSRWSEIDSATFDLLSRYLHVVSS